MQITTKKKPNQDINEYKTIKYLTMDTARKAFQLGISCSFDWTFHSISNIKLLIIIWSQWTQRRGRKGNNTYTTWTSYWWNPFQLIHTHTLPSVLQSATQHIPIPLPLVSLLPLQLVSVTTKWGRKQWQTILIHKSESFKDWHTINKVLLLFTPCFLLLFLHFVSTTTITTPTTC